MPLRPRLLNNYDHPYDRTGDVRVQRYSGQAAIFGTGVHRQRSAQFKVKNDCSSIRRAGGPVNRPIGGAGPFRVACFVQPMETAA